MNLIDKLVCELRGFVARTQGAEREQLTEKIFSLVLGKLIFRDCETGERVRAYGKVRVEARGRVIIGSRTFFLRGMIPSELVAQKGAELRIGEASGFNYGSTIEAHQQVEIGSRCMIGSMVRICDRGPGGILPVIVEDDVWIAHGAILEPGARIGRGSVVSAGSVVLGEIPAESLAVGNPARAMKLGFLRGRVAQAGSE